MTTARLGAELPHLSGPDALTASMEGAVVRELVSSWKQVNLAYFKGALRLPLVELSRAESRLGLWRPETRTLEIGRALVLSHPWGTVLEVLKHEMAHQYVHEVLGRIDETSHGPAFRETCTRLGIDGAASGIPRAGTDDDGARIVARIAKLLALAESPNQHEAEAAMAAAQKLMLRYIDARPTPQDYGFRHLGKPSGRVTESERLLSTLLGKHFFVEVIWVPVFRALEGKRGSILEVCGTQANLAMAEYVHGFLTQTAEALWDAHKRSLGTRSNRDRRVYLAGVMSGFAEKLARESVRHKEAGLVWVKDGDLGAFYRRRHPYVRLVRHAGQRRTAAFADGKEAGKRIVLRRGVSEGPSGGTRLLPPKGR